VKKQKRCPRETAGKGGQMKTIHRVKVYLATVGLALALTSGGCATMAPKAEKYVSPPLGSTFTYTRTDTGSYGSETTTRTSKVIEHAWEGKQVSAFAFPDFVLLVNADGTWPAVLTLNGSPMLSWDPPIGWDFPLVVGKTWNKSYLLTIHSRQQTVPYNSTWKFESYGDIKVPAGTFKAFKISISDTLGNEDTHWYCPSLGTVKQSLRRNNMFVSGAGTRDVELVSHTIKK
jgi:hypothetical protein